MTKYSIFHVQGGIGKHVAATAVARAIKNNHPDRQLIVVCAYIDVFINLPWVDRVYAHGQTSYFYQNYVRDQDSIIFHQEPYFTTDHIHHRLPLAQTWCKMYNLPYNGEQPEIRFNRLQVDASRKHWFTGNKPIMVIHTNGGMQTTQAQPYSWTRDMPESLAQRLVDHYRDRYQIYQVTKLNSPKLTGATAIFATVERSLSIMELFSLVLHSKKRILIDSCLQHAAAALKLPSVVLWNGTSPRVFGYDMHTNITTKVPVDFKLPGSYLFDFDFNGNDMEYPYGDQQELYDFDSIVQAVDAQ